MLPATNSRMRRGVNGVRVGRREEIQRSESAASVASYTELIAAVHYAALCGVLLHGGCERPMVGRIDVKPCSVTASSHNGA